MTTTANAKIAHGGRDGPYVIVYRIKSGGWFIAFGSLHLGPFTARKAWKEGSHWARLCDAELAVVNPGRRKDG